MTVFHPHRLTTIAGVLIAVFAMVAGSALWLRSGPEAKQTPPVWLAGDVERHFMPGELGFEGGGASFGEAQIDIQRGRVCKEREFLTRTIYGVEQADGGSWGRNNRLTPGLSFSHNLGSVFPPELYALYPHFFPMEKGRRIRPPVGAAWWNPDIGREDVAKYAGNRARAYFSQNPAAMSFALGVTDGLIYGESPELLALTTPLRWFRERPDYSNLVFTFMNRTAANIAATHPEKYLGALAYYWAENAPDFALHPQVVPFLTADRSQGYDRAFREEEHALQMRWIARMQSGRAKLNTKSRTSSAEDVGLQPELPMRLGLYDYIYGYGFLIPRIHTRLIAQNLRVARRLGFSDYFAEMTPNWGLDGPQPWLVAQLLQDPDQSERRLLAEYYRRYFRESAFLMQRFFERCEEQWIRQPGRSYWLKHYRNESQAAVFPSAVCRELRAFLDESLVLAKSDTVRLRVLQVSDAFGVTQRFVAMYEARDVVSRLALAGEATDKDLMAALSRFHIMRKDFVTYTECLQREQPLLVGPFRMVDYLLNDPTVNVLARIARCGERGEKGTQGEGPPSGASHHSSFIRHLMAVQNSGDELIANPELRGPLQSARVIAGLAYKVALPAPWQSKVEPSEYQTAGIKAGQPGVLFIGGSKDAEVFQWAALGKRSFVRAQVKMRGRVSESTVVMLTLSWLDANHRHLKMSAIRLPEGEWPAWVDLVQADETPTGAAWVGLSLTVRHQAKDDWIEAQGFSLRGK